MYKLTYAETVKFYKDKEEWPKYTKLFMEKGLGQKTINKNNYLGLADTIISGSEAPDDENKRFFDHIMSDFKNMAVFKDWGSDEAIKEFILSPTDKSKAVDGRPSQKWHLFTSYIAYQEAAAREPSLNLNPRKDFKEVKTEEFEKTAFTYYRYAVCPELMLWLAETALGSDDPDISNAYRKCLDISSQTLQEMCKEIRNIIPWEKIQNKITID